MFFLEIAVAGEKATCL